MFKALKKYWKLHYKVVLVSVLLLSSIYIRFADLGYSHFYGDETKTLYLDKTVSALNFFLNQRKAPVQFFVVWMVEKFTGGYDEQATRLPFALAGFLSVMAFFLLAQKMFGFMPAFVSTTLYSFSGFSVAFSRFVQYQSFLLLFGFTALFLLLLFLENPRKKVYLFFSAVFLALALLCHYDAVFFLLPAFYFVFVSPKNDAKKLDVALLFVLPLFIVSGLFYIPYVLGGFFNSNTSGYLLRRFVGSGQIGVNSSWYTILTYNRSALFFIPFVSTIYLFFDKKLNEYVKGLILWFVVPFVFFQFVVLNPGTHIQNYLIPLYLLVGYSLCELIKNLPFLAVKISLSLYFSVIILLVSATSFVTFVPSLNRDGFPWTYLINKQQYQLFLYGFPYNRAWDQVRDYVSSLNDVNGIYTNDNDILAKYYLRKFDYTPPGSNYYPKYYIHVYSNQEFNDFMLLETLSKTEFYRLYAREKDFFVKGERVSMLYKLKTP